MELTVHCKDTTYPIYIERGLLKNIADYIPEHEKTVIVTDAGVPHAFASLLQKQVPNSYIHVLPQGELSKSVDEYLKLIQDMKDHNMTRGDAVIALGGGVPGDLAGFAAATYMRGVAFYNIPTTVLSQVDSSVGGKTAIDFGPTKNLVGCFYQPRAVLIDPDVLDTMPDRQISNGLVEALKMGLILDADLVDEFEKEEPDLDRIIARSVDLKREIVEQDENETGLRAILNFGHTIGHAIEGAYGLNAYLHGECVAMGILFFIEDPELKERVKKIYQRLDLPAMPPFSPSTLVDYIKHDKKSRAQGVNVVKVKGPGKWALEFMTFDEIQEVLANAQ